MIAVFYDYDTADLRDGRRYDAVGPMWMVARPPSNIEGGADTCQWVSPLLTTVRQPLEEMGRIAARTLFQQLDGEVPVSPRIELATELKVRLSTAAPPA